MKPEELYKKVSEISLFKGFNIHETENILKKIIILVGLSLYIKK